MTTTRRIFLLNGIAILAVLLNHTASWGNTALFWWTDTYLPVTVPNYDQIGSLAYYAQAIVRKLAVFAVPAFFFVSGFFIAYAARGPRSSLTWKMVGTRVRHLLIPYLIWSAVIFFGEALQGAVYAPAEYLTRLLYTGAIGGFYFVPLLCQFYLLSPLLVPLAKTRWRLALAAALLLSLGGIGKRYLALFLGSDAPAVQIMNILSPDWLFFRHAFIFALGVITGLHLTRMRRWLACFKWGLLGSAILFGILALLESELVFRLTLTDWRDSVHTLLTAPYAVAVILSFIAFTGVKIPYSKTLNQLSGKTYGLYLVHAIAMMFIARVIRQVAPWMLSARFQLFTFWPIVFAFGLAVPLLLMAGVAKSPIRKSYRYLFG